MGIPIPGKDGLYIEAGPSCLVCPRLQITKSIVSFLRIFVTKFIIGYHIPVYQGSRQLCCIDILQYECDLRDGRIHFTTCEASLENEKGSYRKISNIRHQITKVKCFSSRFAVSFAQSIEARC